MTGPLLKVEGLRKSFGGVAALRDGRFELEAGSLHALCGGNGAGKSTFLTIVMGIQKRDGGTIYNAQLLFDADGSLAQKRRKISPTYHERMVWGMGDGSGLRAVETAVGRIGSLACWEHYNPLARYSLMADGEQIRVRIREVTPDRLVVIPDDFGVGGPLADAITLEVPEPGRLTPR